MIYWLIVPVCVNNSKPLHGGFTFHRRINESLLALALVEPTQYVTHDVSIPDT